MKTINRTAANRILQKVSMTKPAFVAEHKKLVKVLRSGSSKVRRQEAADQNNELKEQ